MFIPAGAGGVGTLAIQLAKARKAIVATTTSARNVDFVKVYFLTCLPHPPGSILARGGLVSLFQRCLLTCFYHMFLPYMMLPFASHVLVLRRALAYYQQL